MTDFYLHEQKSDFYSREQKPCMSFSVPSMFIAVWVLDPNRFLFLTEKSFQKPHALSSPYEIEKSSEKFASPHPLKDRSKNIERNSF